MAPCRVFERIPTAGRRSGSAVNRRLRALGRGALHLLESGVIAVENLDAAVRSRLAPRRQVLGLMQRCDDTGLGLSMRKLSGPHFVDASVDLSPQSGQLRGRAARPAAAHTG